jgi:hypothetical protein
MFISYATLLLQSLYPNYIPVATLSNMLDINIDAVAKEISQEK